MVDLMVQRTPTPNLIFHPRRGVLEEGGGAETKPDG
jgi:hypothetical protein